MQSFAGCGGAARIPQSEIAGAADEDTARDDATLNIAARDLDALRIDPAIVV
jgi:hypothetical protein